MGQLGVQMPHELHPYSCLPTGVQKEGVKCLEWKKRAKLVMEELEEQDGATCHRVIWTALNKDTSPMDCWPVGPLNGHWYGGGESLMSKWPLDNGRIKLSPFVTGDEDQTEWGNVIRKFFINSHGVSITIEDGTPLSVSLNDNETAGPNNGLCFQANFDDFPYYYHRFNLPVLNYTVCTDGNMKQIFESQLSKSFWDGHQDSDMEVLEHLLQLPLWQVPGVGKGKSYTIDLIEEYLIELLGRGNGKPVSRIERGYLLLDYHWQENMGDFSFNTKNFQDVKMVQSIVKSAGLRLALTINPFVSVESPSFKEGVKNGLFVMERNSSNAKNIPALTWFKVSGIYLLTLNY